MRKLLALAVLFLFSVQGTFAAQIILTTGNGNASQTLDQFLVPSSGILINTENITTGIMPFAGEMGKVTMAVSVAPGVGASRVFGFMKNLATSTAPTCTIADTATSCSFNANLTFVRGDQLVLFNVPVNTPALTRIYGGTVVYPDTLNHISITNRDSSNLNPALEQFEQTHTTSVGISSIEASTTVIMPIAGKFSNIYAVPNATLGAAKTETLSSRVNFASTSQAAIITANTAGQDTTNTVSVNAGDVVDMSINPGGTPTARAVGFASVFTPNDGVTTSIFLASTNATQDLANTTNRFMTMTGDNVITATESIAATISPTTFYMTNIYASTTPAGAGKTRTFSFRVNGVTTGLACSITGATQASCTASGRVQVNAGDLIDTLDVAAATLTNTGNPLVSYAAQDFNGFGYMKPSGFGFIKSGGFGYVI